MRNIQNWQPVREMSGPSEQWGVETTDKPPVMIIKPTTKLDGQDVSLICSTHNAALIPGELLIKSIVSERTGGPVVNVAFKSETLQLTLGEAKAFQAQIGEAIEAGVTDAFIAKWLRTKISPHSEEGKLQHMISRMLSEFREYRDELNGVGVKDVTEETPSS
jgi:hypothetical protein